METVEVSAIESVVYFDGDEVVPCECRLTFIIKNLIGRMLKLVFLSVEKE
jgi:hypothetical protein